MTTPKMFDRVALVHDVPTHGLKRGDVAVFVDRVPHLTVGSEGAVLEVFNAVGESIATVIVAITEIEPLAPNEVLSVRLLEDGPASTQQPV